MLTVKITQTTYNFFLCPANHSLSQKSSLLRFNSGCVNALAQYNVQCHRRATLSAVGKNTSVCKVAKTVMLLKISFQKFATVNKASP